MTTDVAVVVVVVVGMVTVAVTEDGIVVVMVVVGVETVGPAPAPGICPICGVGTPAEMLTVMHGKFIKHFSLLVFFLQNEK